MSKTTLTPKQIQRQRLIGLAVWAAGEKAKQDLDLPSEWDQGIWLGSNSCGTTCCIAGKIALEDGGIPSVYDEDADEYVTDPVKALELWRSDAWVNMDVSSVFFPGSDEEHDVSTYAQGVLGLDNKQANLLFEADNKLEDVINAVRVILAENK